MHVALRVTVGSQAPGSVGRPNQSASACTSFLDTPFLLRFTLLRLSAKERSWTIKSPDANC